MDTMANIITAVGVVILSIAFPLWAAHRASKRGHKKWAKITIISTFLGLGFYVALAALWAARTPIEESEAQQQTEADRIRSKGRTWALLASIGVTAVVGAVIAVTVAMPMSNRALEQSLSNPRVSAAEAFEAMSSASSSGTTVAAFVGLCAGIATIYLVRNHFNERASRAEREASRAAWKRSAGSSRDVAG